MLKVTESINSERRIELILEGRIVGDCISYLENICLLYLDKDSSEIFLDFTGVRYVESRGVEMLKKLSGLKFNIVNCPIFIAELLNQ